MRKKLVTLCLFATLVQFSLMVHGQETKPGATKPKAEANEKKGAFKLRDVEYFHRFTDKDLHEYTPANQEDLEKWSDMVSINYYRTAKDGDGLAAMANAVLEAYKSQQGRVLATKSVPRTEEKPAEHLVVVFFIRAEFHEVAFARFRIHEGLGTSVVYSHRAYGDQAKDEMIAWLKKSAPETEKALMKWDEMPKLPTDK